MPSPSADLRTGLAGSGAGPGRLRVLTLTNMYPTEIDPGWAPFVPEQVAAVRADPRVEVCDVQLIDGRASTWNYARGLKIFRDTIAEVPYDVVHAHYGLTGAIAVTQKRLPVVVTFHGGDLDGPLRSTKWQRQISRGVARRTAANVCVSQKMQPVLWAPSTHLPCGIDLGAFTPHDRKRARARFQVPDGALALLFPSSPSRDYKNFPGFREVVGELRSRGHDIHEMVLQGIPRAEVPEFLAAADVMVLTSTQEGTPVAVMEAMSCGLPVVATDVGDVDTMLAKAAPADAFVAKFHRGLFADAVQRLARPPSTVRTPLPGCDQFDGARIGAALVDIFVDVARR